MLDLCKGNQRWQADSIHKGFHYNDVIMTTMASQITSLTIVYSIVYSDKDQRKHLSSASLAFMWGIVWRLASPNHHQQWQWPCGINDWLPSMRKVFNLLCHVSVVKLIYFECVLFHITVLSITKKQKINIPTRFCEKWQENIADVHTMFWYNFRNDGVNATFFKYTKINL